VNPFFSWLGIGAGVLSPFTPTARDAGTTKPRQIVLPSPSAGASGPVSIEPDSFGGQVGKGLGQGLGTLVKVLTIGAVVILIGPQLLGLFTQSAVRAVRS